MMKKLDLRTHWQDMRIRYVVMGLAFCLIPLLVSAGVLASSAIILIGSMLIYAIAGIGLDILLGYGGMISLGTAGFMGLAAYLSAYFVETMGLPFELSFVLAIAIPVVLGILVGLASLRIEGIYLAIATLCIAEVLRKIFEQLTSFTNSFSGKKANYPVLLGFIELDRYTAFVFVVVVLVVVMILVHNLINSQKGRSLHAARGSDVAAQAMGINLLKARLLSFAVATGLASLSGILYMHFIRFTYPSTWTLTMSLSILAVVVIGGMRSSFGMIIGAFMVFVVPEVFLKQLPVIGEINGLSYIFNGILIILVIILYPQGLVHCFHDIKKLFAKKKKGGVSNHV